MMHSLIREEHSFGANPGAKDLARHLYTRMNSGRVVIVAERPTVLMSQLHKHWFKLMRKVQREASSTLNLPRVHELNGTVVRMQMMEFTTKWSQDDYQADVYIATIEQLLTWAPECRTLYVTCEMQPEHMHMITAWMNKGGLVVIAKLSHSKQ